MRNQRIARDMAERPDTVGTLALAPVKFHASSVHPKNSQPTYGSAGIPLEWDNVAELKIHLDGLPIQIRFSLDEASTKTLLGAIATDTSHSLLRSALGKIADQIRGSTTRRIGLSSGPTLTAATTTPSTSSPSSSRARRSPTCCATESCRTATCCGSARHCARRSRTPTSVA